MQKGTVNTVPPFVIITKNQNATPLLTFLNIIDDKSTAMI